MRQALQQWDLKNASVKSINLRQSVPLIWVETFRYLEIFCVLTHYQMTNFRLFQSQSLQTTILDLTKTEESHPNG